MKKIHFSMNKLKQYFLYITTSSLHPKDFYKNLDSLVSKMY